MEEKKRILVVDDEEGIRNFIKEVLELFFSVEVLIASDGQQGLEIFKSNQFDLVISDVVMPGLSGLELLKKIKKTKSKTKVIIISGYPGGIEIEEFTQAGANGFLQKPFSADDIKKLVENS